MLIEFNSQIVRINEVLTLYEIVLLWMGKTVILSRQILEKMRVLSPEPSNLSLLSE